MNCSIFSRFAKKPHEEISVKIILMFSLKKWQITILHMMLIYNMAEKKPLTEGDLEMETDLIL